MTRYVKKYLGSAPDKQTRGSEARTEGRSQARTAEGSLIHQQPATSPTNY